MKDEKRFCATCGKEHRWGILGYHNDVPLYNAFPTKKCKTFRPQVIKTEENKDLMYPDSANLPMEKNGRELWAQTGDLNAQATMATRLVVHRLKSLAKGKSGYQKMSAQWPEFIGFVVSQITDMRGALVRDESKFARLVAHTDEILVALQDGVRLREQLAHVNRELRVISDRLAELEPPQPPEPDVEAFIHFGLIDESVRPFYESLRATKGGILSTPLRDEPILIEAGPDDDDDDEGDDEDNGDEEMEPVETGETEEEDS